MSGESSEQAPARPCIPDLEAETERQIALLKAIIMIFREAPGCDNEETMARICLKAAEDLTGSAYSFIGELNTEGRFDTTTVSEAGWRACRIPVEEAVHLLKNMPARGINRAGLKEGRPWIINDPASHPDSVEKPPGHPPITSFMGVPLRYMGGITGMIALAGKQPGYTETDKDAIEALTAAFMESLNRRRAERVINELNAELQRHVEQIEAANRELEAFSYSVSHDLRAPLRHITGFVELLNKRGQELQDEKSRHYLQVISDASRKMGALIDDLLAFSRMGRAEIQKGRIDFNALVREVLHEQSADTKGRSIEWEIADLPAGEGDAAMLRQVFANLVANALKFTSRLPLARIGIGAVSDQPGEIRFFVRDNGVGFDMKYADKLFGLFQRLHSNEEFEGTGVGLANCQRIIHRHGGRIWAEAAVGSGATFWFTLPARKEE
jgi:signal transduction histidine kinase